jgi:hypothetical protein
LSVVHHAFASFVDDGYFTNRAWLIDAVPAILALVGWRSIRRTIAVAVASLIVAFWSPAHAPDAFTNSGIAAGAGVVVCVVFLVVDLVARPVRRRGKSSEDRQD